MASDRGTSLLNTWDPGFGIQRKVGDLARPESRGSRFRPPWQRCRCTASATEKSPRAPSPRPCAPADSCWPQRPRRHDPPQAGVLGSGQGPVHEDIDRGLLEGGGDVGDALFRFSVPELLALVDHRGLQTRIGNVVERLALVQGRLGEIEMRADPRILKACRWRRRRESPMS